jgi:hypothetical protein
VRFYSLALSGVTFCLVSTNHATSVSVRPNMSTDTAFAYTRWKYPETRRLSRQSVGRRQLCIFGYGIDLVLTIKRPGHFSSACQNTSLYMGSICYVAERRALSSQSVPLGAKPLETHALQLCSTKPLRSYALLM